MNRFYSARRTHAQFVMFTTSASSSLLVDLDIFCSRSNIHLRHPPNHPFSSMNQIMDGVSNDCTRSPWYFKCKTPASFGPFWDTAQVAINGTRARLLTAQKLSNVQTNVARKWLFMHPCDAIINPHCHIVVVRVMGLPFRGQIAWPSFAQAYFM
jgi:hypothetical protein